jgi:hypothetical protein
MIEMRWYVPVVGEKVLQYRQKIDITVRAEVAGMWNNESIMRTANMQWTPWKDVPMESEKDPNCP